MPQTLFEIVRDRAESQPEHPAVLSPGKHTATYRDLLQFVQNTRSSLHRLGVNRTTRIGILLPQRVQTAVAHLAVASTCISAPLNPDMTPDELSATVRDLHLDTLILADEIPKRLMDRASSLDVQIVTARTDPKIAGFFDIAAEAKSGRSDATLPVADDLAVLMKTSGTTSKQKTVPRTHTNQVAQLIRFSEALGITPSDLCLNLMPVYHTTGIGSEFLAPIISGASVVFVDLNPATFESDVKNHQPTWFNLVPSMHQAVLARFEGRSGVFKDSSMKFTRSSSAKMPQTLRQRIEETYGVPLVESYGTTETGSITFTRISEGDFKQGSVGRPAHDGVVIMDADGIAVPPGVVGEVCVNGPTVMTGYENDAETNAEVFRNGYYRTGDEAHVDEDGFIFVAGRLRETVNRGGEKFSLAEIDEAILKVKGVTQGASFAAPHPELGQEIYAAVVAMDGTQLGPADVRAELAARLSWAKVPKRVIVVKELPFNSTGKIVRANLAKILER